MGRSGITISTKSEPLVKENSMKQEKIKCFELALQILINEESNITVDKVLKEASAIYAWVMLPQ